MKTIQVFPYHTGTMSWERLPLELVEGIFDHLQQDRQVLKICSLVCKSWLYPAYRRLFYDTRLSWDQLRVVFDSRSESTAAPFIRCLRIAHDSSHQWNGTFRSLDGFHSVTSLCLESLFWYQILPDMRMTIFNRFNAVTRLELRIVVTTSFSEFAQMICSFRSLESLILGPTDWDIRDNTPSTKLPQNFHGLEFDGNEFKIFEWLMSFGHDLNLRNVCFLNPRNRQVIDTFLRVLGPSLESFRIFLKGVLSFVS